MILPNKTSTSITWIAKGPLGLSIQGHHYPYWSPHLSPWADNLSTATINSRKCHLSPLIWHGVFPLGIINHHQITPVTLIPSSCQVTFYPQREVSIAPNWNQIWREFLPLKKKLDIAFQILIVWNYQIIGHSTVWLSSGLSDVCEFC